MINNTVSRKKIQNYSYIITNVIGKGYSSQVFRGRNDLTNQEVAIKVIDLKLLKNQINRVLLESQINILKEIKALPHILNLHDVFTTKNNTYIITELCDSDFSKTIKQKLTEAEACSYMEQIIKGYIHFASKDIIHRDLKPANILVSNSELKIADFGFAIKICDAHKYNKYNVGSPLYMAPESLKRNQYSLQSDIWALGIIFYEMLTGTTPWKAKNEKELLKKIESESIDDILQIMAISNNSKMFLRKALKLDKKARLSIQDLQEYRFCQTNFSNILMQKKCNGVKLITHQKSLSIFEQNISLKTCKTPNHSQKKTNVKQIFLKKTDNQINNQNMSIKIHVKPLNQNNSIKSINLHFLQGQGKNKTSQNENTSDMHYKSVNEVTQEKRGDNKGQKKMITKILISQIHFCRFLYKLLMKILQSSKKGLLQYSRAQVQRIMCSYVGIIKHKIENVLSFPNINFLKVAHYQQYKMSSDFEKIIKIAKEYKSRYAKDLIIHWSSAKVNFSVQPTDDLICHINQLLALRKDNEDIIIKNQREIVILDYLMTSKRLFDFFKNQQSYQRFAKRSKIEDIVEGKALVITNELFKRIMERAAQTIRTQYRQLLPAEEGINI